MNGEAGALSLVPVHSLCILQKNMAILFGDNYCQARFQVQKGIKGKNSIQMFLRLVAVDTFFQDSTTTSDILRPRYTTLRASNYKET